MMKNEHSDTLFNWIIRILVFFDLERILISATVILGLITVFIVGRDIGRFDIQKEAIKNKAAEYECNKETGECKFVWIK